MSSKRNHKKELWIRRGIGALKRIQPDLPDGYVCPLCARLLPRDGDLTLEDVPPKSAGGKPLVVTCGPCNHTSGSALDHFIKAGREEREIAEGKRSMHVRLSVAGTTIAALGTFSSDRMSFAGLPERSDPKASAAFRAVFEEAHRTGSTGWEMQVHMRRHANPRKESIAWLRVGYLYAFAALGYRYVLRPNLDRLRDQFKRPEEQLVRGLVRTVPQPLEQDGILLVSSPAKYTSVIVHLGGKVIFLPDLEGSQDFYDRFAGDLPGPIKFRGTLMNLPREPIHWLDRSQSRAV